MERNQALQDNWRGGLKEEEPHFDDERTILSAQPVVPLNAVANEQSRRRWILVGAFVIASLLGSAVALALVRLRQPDPVNNAVVTESNAVEQRTEEPVSQVAEQEVSEPETTSAAPLAGEVETDVSVSAPRTEKPKRQVPATSPRSAPREVTITVEPNPPSNTGQARLVDQWQERRQRRVNRKPQNHHSSDLFRIRDIFEGPRRNRRLNN